MGTCLQAFTPSPDNTHTFAQTHTCSQMHLMPSSVSFSSCRLPLWSKALVIRCPRFFVCSFVVGDKRRAVSLSTSLFVCCYFSLDLLTLLSLHFFTPIAMSQFVTLNNMLFNIFCFWDSEFVQHYTPDNFAFGELCLLQFPVHTTGEQQWLSC